MAGKQYVDGWSVDRSFFHVNSASGRGRNALDEMPVFGNAVDLKARVTREQLLVIVRDAKLVNGTLPSISQEIVVGEQDLKYLIMRFSRCEKRQAQSIRQHRLLISALAGYVDGQPVALRTDVQSACAEYARQSSASARGSLGGRPRQ